MKRELYGGVEVHTGGEGPGLEEKKSLTKTPPAKIKRVYVVTKMSINDVLTLTCDKFKVILAPYFFSNLLISKKVSIFTISE